MVLFDGAKSAEPPINIGKLAAKADVGMVVLTHFVPVPEQLIHPNRLITEIRRFYKGRVVMARDLDSFS